MQRRLGRLFGEACQGRRNHQKERVDQIGIDLSLKVDSALHKTLATSLSFIIFVNVFQLLAKYLLGNGCFDIES